MNKIRVNAGQIGVEVIEDIYRRAQADPTNAGMTFNESMLAMSMTQIAPSSVQRLSSIAAYGFTSLGPDTIARLQNDYFVTAEVSNILSSPPAEWPAPIEAEDTTDEVTPEDLSLYKAQQRRRVTNSANDQLSRIATQNFRKIMTYIEKRREAAKYRSEVTAGGTPDPLGSNYIHLMVDVAAGEVPDLEASVTRVEETAEQWRGINASIEGIERTANQLIENSSDLGGVLVAANNAVTEMRITMDTVLQQQQQAEEGSGSETPE